jgi:hypothetical protein
MPVPPLWMPPQAAPPPGLLQAPPGAVWDHNDLAHNFNTMTLTPPPNTEWYMDSGASSHMASNSGILSHVFSPNYSTPTSIVVGNGSLLPVTSTGHTYFPSTSRPLYLYDVLVSHDIIKNLISVRRFTTDSLVSEKFDPLPSSDFDFLSEFNAMPLPIGPCFRSHVCAGTCSSDVGVAPSAPIAPGSSTCPWPVATPVSQAPLVSDAPDPESPGRGASTPASASNDPSAHLPESVGLVAAWPSTSSAFATAKAGPDPASAIPGAMRITPVQNDHRMVTRGKHGFRQPKERLNLHAATLSPLPKTYRGALADPNWRDAMCEEFAALQANDTWSLVPWPADTNVVTGKCVFRHKFLPDGALDRYKACWVLHGFTQQHGLIMVRLSALSSNLPLSGRFSLLHSLTTGLFIRWM